MATTAKAKKKPTKSMNRQKVAAASQMRQTETRRKLVRQAFKLAIALHRDTLKELERY